jgi:predicted secreted Zn-dependent protease
MIDFPPQDAGPAVASERLTAAVPTLAALPNVVLVGYPVDGRSRRGIREQMNARRPEVNGQRHDARTTWRYATRWRGGPGGACLPQTSEVTVSITVTMPDLQDPDRLNRDERAAWDRYMVGLELHEGNHARIANLGAEQMQAAMRAASSCEEMQAVVERIGSEISAASVEYDRRTQHGATEGARF